MKASLILFIILFSSNVFYAQETEEELSILKDIQLRQTNMAKASMISLNSWAIANITYGTIANFNSSGEAKYFHQMNAIWNVVNLGIGIPGIIGAYKKQTPLNFKDLYEYQQRIEKVYFLNIGLDAAYITGGVALRLFGNDKPTEVRHRLQGYGNSLLMQGGYLLVHDIALLLMYKSNTKLFEQSWKHVKFSSYGLNFKVEFD